MAYFALILLLFHSDLFAGYQNLAVATGQSDFYYDSAKSQTFARFAANDPIYNSGTQTVNTTRAYNVVGIDGKTYQTTIARSAAADIPKVGSALSKFAQRVGPLAMGIATVDLICSLADICNLNGIFEKSISLSGVDAIKTHVGWCVNNGGSTPCYSDKDFDDAVKSANGCLTASNSNCELDGVRELIQNGNLVGLEYRFRFISDGSFSQYYPATFFGTYTEPSATSQPVTESDWTAAEAPLSTPAGAERLAAELEPMPIHAPSAYTPFQLPLGKVDTVTRDAQGVATGTRTTEKRLTLEDASTLTEPNRSIVEETTITTDYDVNNQPLGSTETTTETQTEPQPEPEPVAENFEIEIDDVQDDDLTEQAATADFTATSWGSGSCPPDLQTNYSKGVMTIKSQPFCDMATDLKPIILLIASIIAAYTVVSSSRPSTT